MGLKTDIILNGIDKSKQAFNSVKQRFGTLRADVKNVTTEMSSLERFSRRVHTTLLGFVGLNILQNASRRVVEMTDSMKLMSARMTVALKDTRLVNSVTEQLAKISAETGTELSANGILFTRLARPMKQLGKEISDTVQITELLNKGLKLSGATSGETSSIIRQFSQAMASGVLRGDEFNSIMENGSRISEALGEALGKTSGELREMAESGELTSEVVLNALQSQFDTINAEFEKMPRTIEAAMTNVSNAFQLTSSENEKFKNTASETAEVLDLIADNMDGVVQSGITLAKLAGIGLSASILKLGKQKLNTALETRKLAKEQSELNDIFRASERPITKFESTVKRVNTVYSRNTQVIKSNIQSIGDYVRQSEIAIKVQQRRNQTLIEQQKTRQAELVSQIKSIQNDKNEIDSKSRLARATDLLTKIESQLSLEKAKSGTSSQRYNSLLNREQVVKSQIEIVNKKLKDSQTQLGNAVKSHSEAVRQQNVLLQRNKVLQSQINDIAVKRAANDYRGLGGAIRGVSQSMSGLIGLFKTGSRALLSFGGSLLVFEALNKGVEIASNLGKAFLTLRDAQKQLQEADSNTARLLEENANSWRKRANLLGINYEQYGNNIAAIAEVVKATEDERNSISTLNDLLNKGIVSRQEYDNVVKEGVQSVNSLIAAHSNEIAEYDRLDSKIDEIITQFQQWSDQGIISSNQIIDKLNQMTDKELQEYKQAITDAMDTGILKSQQLRDELDLVNQSITEKAFEKFGLETKSQLEQTANDFRTAFDEIERSGQATSQQLQQAFIKYANAAITANQGVASEALTAEAAQRGLAITYDETGKAIIRNIDELSNLERQSNSTSNTINSNNQSNVTSQQTVTRVVNDTVQSLVNQEQQAIKTADSYGKIMDAAIAAGTATQELTKKTNEAIRSAEALTVARRRAEAEQARNELNNTIQQRNSRAGSGVNTSNADSTGLNSDRNQRVRDKLESNRNQSGFSQGAFNTFSGEQREKIKTLNDTEFDRFSSELDRRFRQYITSRAAENQSSDFRDNLINQILRELGTEERVKKTRQANQQVDGGTGSAVRNVNLNLSLNNGRSVQGTFPDNAATRNLIDQLRRAGFTS